MVLNLEKFSRQFNAAGVVVVHELLKVFHRSTVHREVYLVIDFVFFGRRFCDEMRIKLVAAR